MQRLKAVNSLLSQMFGYRNGQGVQKGDRRRHGMVLFFRAPVGKQADVRPLFRGQVGAAYKGQRSVARNAAVLQQNMALPRELGEAEQHHQILRSGLDQPFQQL